MEGLIKEQTSLGTTIQQVISTWKKQPLERRTQEFYVQKIEELNALWARFNKRDNQIRDLSKGLEDHEYFTNDYFQKIMDKITETRDQLKSKLEELKSSASVEAAGSSTKPQPVPRSQETKTSKDYKKQQQIVVTVKSIINSTIARADNGSTHFFEMQLATI